MKRVFSLFVPLLLLASPAHAMLEYSFTGLIDQYFAPNQEWNLAVGSLVTGNISFDENAALIQDELEFRSYDRPLAALNLTAGLFSASLITSPSILLKSNSIEGVMIHSYDNQLSGVGLSEQGLLYADLTFRDQDWSKLPSLDMANLANVQNFDTRQLVITACGPSGDALPHFSMNLNLLPKVQLAESLPTAPVPEPATIALVGLGLGLGLVKRRKHV